VFAIAITLLVLELKVPPRDADLAAALLSRWPSYVAFATSFATIGIMWLNHHRLFTLIHRADHGTLVLNGLLLFGVTFLPFPTAVVAEHFGHAGERVAALLYSGTFVFTALAFYALLRYATSPGRAARLFAFPASDPRVVAVVKQYRWGPAIYGTSFAASWAWPRVGLALILALAVFFAFPPRGARRGAD